MVVIPVRFKRATAPFDETARARLCESSGSDHSAAGSSEHSTGSSSPELADLVDSFIEWRDGGDCRCHGCEVEGNTEDCCEEEIMSQQETHEESIYSPGQKKKKKTKKKMMIEKRRSEEAVECDSESDTEETTTLQRLFGSRTAATGPILAETDRAMVRVGKGDQGLMKRAVMAELRDRGLDAGLCKSRWEKTGRHPGGKYEYIDVIAGDDRYIVETNLKEEFEIARPTDRYLALLALVPPVFVGKPEALKRVVRLMCAAAKKSLKSSELHLPPWRRTGYVQAKWFGAFKRTTNRSPVLSSGGSCAVLKRDVGFEAVAAVATMMGLARDGRCGGEAAVMERLTTGGGNNRAGMFHRLHLI